MQLKKLLNPSIKLKKKRRFYIGILFVFIFFIIAYVHNNNVAYIVMFFIFSILSVSLLFGRINIGKSKVFLKDKRFFANQKSTLPLIVKGNVSFDKDVIFNKRGYNDLYVELFSDYPIGVATFYKKVYLGKVLVYPELKGKSLVEMGRGEDLEFDSLKEYEGESLKYIHWASLAKGDIKAKRFSGDSKADRLVFDYSLIKGDKEAKISQLAKWAKEAFERGIEFEITLPNKKISSKEGLDEIFKELALY